MSPHDMADKVLAEEIRHSGPNAATLSDPIADTPIMVTLDQLRPYELDPRITRNPLFDEIKASIRERGLDAPPPITRRPEADHYIIRNGGNTRLAVLRELWTETKDERFFRIACLFRPWPERGEIVALTGHLAENELHGGLTFIERALGVEKVRELYEQEVGQPLSQSELARRLRADGYPVLQPHISRMQEAIRYLLPAIPNVLYGGLGRPQIEQLTNLRRAGPRSWEARAAVDGADGDFAELFQQVLSAFDLSPSALDIERIQDELIGQMADQLGERYDTLAFEFTVPEKRPLPPVEPEPVIPPLVVQRTAPPSAPTTTQTPVESVDPAYGFDHDVDETDVVSSPGSTAEFDHSYDGGQESEGAEERVAALLREHIVDPAQASDRLQSIQRLIADHLGEEPSDFEGNVLKSVPVQAGGLYPISDIWHIEAGLDEPERLRLHIEQFAREIADEAGLVEAIAGQEDGIGFECQSIGRRDNADEKAVSSRGILALLHALSAPYSTTNRAARIDTLHLVSDLGPLLLGWKQSETAPGVVPTRLSDSALVKLFRLIRLARRLIEIDTAVISDSAPPAES